MTNLKNVNQETIRIALRKIRNEESIYKLSLDLLEEGSKDYQESERLLNEAINRKKQLINYIDSQSIEDFYIDWL